MPVTFASTTINNQTKEYLSVREVDGDFEVIMKDNLEQLDIDALDDIEDNGVGATFYDKMLAYDMVNGQKAYDYFSDFYRPLLEHTGQAAKEFHQTARGAVTETLTVGVNPDNPHVFVSFKYFDSDQYTNEVAATGNIEVSGRPTGASGYFEIFGSPVSAADPAAYAEQGSSLNSIRSVPVTVGGATHYIMTVVAISEGQ